MATTEQIVLQVDVVTNNQRLVELQKQLIDNRAAVADLNASFKAGKITTDELAAAQVRLKQDAANVATEQRSLTAANKAQETANKTQTGSIAQLRAQLALGTAEYIKLSAASRDTTAAGQKLQAENKQVSDSLKILEKAIGDTRRNVGNYEEAFNKVTGTLDKFGSSAKSLPGPLGAIGSGLVGTASGFVTATRAALAFLATPIGLVLGLVAAAVYAVRTAFESSAEGQGKYSRLMAQVGVAAGNVRDVIITLGAKLITAFETPQKSLIELGKIINDNFTTRFVGLLELIPAVGRAIVLLFEGKFKVAGIVAADAVGKVALGVNSITTSYNDASNALNKFSAESVADAAQQKIASEFKRQAGKLDRALITERAEAEDKIATLQLQSRQKEQFSAGLRIGFLKQANSLRDELSAKEIKVATLRADAGKIEATLSKQTRDQLTEQANRQKDVIEAGTRAVEARRGNQRLLNSLNAEIRAADQKDREDAVLREKAKVENLLAVATAGSAAELVLKQRLIQLAADLELTGIKKTGGARAEIQAKADLQIQKLAEEFNKTAVENAKKATEATIKERLREYEEAKKSLEDYLADKTAQIEQDFAQGKTNKREAERQFREITTAGLQAELVNAQDYSQKTGAIEKKQSENTLKELTRLKNEKKKIKQAETDIAQTALSAGLVASDAIIEAFGKESKAGQVALAIKKTLAIADIGINLEKQLSLNATTAAELNVVLPGSGIIYEVVADALAIASAVSGTAKVLGFNTGGLVPGAGNTDSVPALLTPGEIVMNKTASTQYAPVLSYLNAISGGANFTPGFTPPPVGAMDGGLAARSLGGGAGVDYKQLAAAMAQQPISVDVRAIAVQQGRVAKARSLSTLGS